MRTGLVIVLFVVAGAVLVALLEVGVCALFARVWSWLSDHRRRDKKEGDDQACGFGYVVVQSLRPLPQAVLLISYSAAVILGAAFGAFEMWLPAERILLIGVTLWAINSAVFLLLLLASARLQRICLPRAVTLAPIRSQVAKLVIALLVTALVCAIITWCTSDSNWHSLE